LVGALVGAAAGFSALYIWMSRSVRSRLLGAQTRPDSVLSKIMS